MFCSSCQKEKPESSFYRNAQRRTGRDHYCIDCRKAYTKRWSKTPAGEECRRLNRRNFYLSNRDYELSKSRQWRKGVRQGTPSWLTETHHRQIEYIYAQARDCRFVTGEPYEVDHIVPIRGEHICGLHVPWNLQVLPADLNRAKSNVF